PQLAAGPRLAVAVERAGAWGTLCAVAGDQSDVWCRDPHRGQCTQGGAVLRDVSRHGHQWATAHPGVEAAVIGPVLVLHLEALAGHRGLSGAERGCVLRPSSLTPDGVLGVVLHLPRGVQRAADDGGDHLQSEALLALCRLRSSCVESTFTVGGRDSRMNTCR